MIRVRDTNQYLTLQRIFQILTSLNKSRTSIKNFFSKKRLQNRDVYQKSFLLILMSLIRIYQPGKRDLIDFFLFYLKELYLRAFPFFIFNHLLEEDNNDC